MCAVLKDAIRCLAGEVGGGLERLRHAGEARAWFVSHDGESPLSFESVCHWLDFDTDRLRAQILRRCAAAGGARAVVGGHFMAREGRIPTLSRAV